MVTEDQLALGRSGTWKNLRFREFEFIKDPVNEPGMKRNSEHIQQTWTWQLSLNPFVRGYQTCGVRPRGAH